jgi:hypothetical protein
MTPPRLVIDRFEGDVAVVEFGTTFLHLPVAALPEGCREGDVLVISRVPGDLSDAEARLARLKATSDQGPGSFDL